MTKQIVLASGETALVDDEDFPVISQFHWFYRHGYAMRWGRKRLGEQRRQLRMHRQICGFPVGKDVDHTNGNGLDNRRCNLRVCEHAENMRNQYRRAAHSSQYKGVSRCATTGRWIAKIGVNFKQVHLGRFDSEEEAAMAYDRAAQQYFGEFAQLNFKIAS